MLPRERVSGALEFGSRSASRSSITPLPQGSWNTPGSCSNSGAAIPTTSDRPIAPRSLMQVRHREPGATPGVLNGGRRRSARAGFLFAAPWLTGVRDPVFGCRYCQKIRPGFRAGPHPQAIPIDEGFWARSKRAGSAERSPTRCALRSGRRSVENLDRYARGFAEFIGARTPSRV